MKLEFSLRRFSQFLACMGALSVLSLPVLQPFLTGTLVRGYDQILHLWRAVEADALLAKGVWFSRWQPHMALGLGYPLFLFNPPLSAYLAVMFRHLGLEWPGAVNAVFAVGVVLSMWSVWLLVREWWSNGAGVVAGVVIGFLPFHAYVLYHRGSMSEALAWGFPALILWGLLRWQNWGQRRGLLIAVLASAALFLTHDATAYLFFPIACVACLMLALGLRDGVALRRGVGALALGLGLPAFFWFPSVLERPYVQFARVTEYPYTASFVALDYLLERPRSVEVNLINPQVPKGLGVLPVALALGAFFAWRAERRERFWLAGVGLATLGCVYLTLPCAGPLWHLFPVLRYLHFPWRFLTPAAFGVAILAGAGAARIARLFSSNEGIVNSILIGVLVLGSLGWLYPPRITLSYPATLAGMVAYERDTGQLGGTTFSELLPRWVKVFPDVGPLIKDIESGFEPVRLLAEDLPAGASIIRAAYSPLEAHIELESPVEFRRAIWHSTTRAGRSRWTGYPFRSRRAIRRDWSRSLCPLGVTRLTCALGRRHCASLQMGSHLLAWHVCVLACYGREKWLIRCCRCVRT